MRKLLVMASMLAAMLVCAAPALADTVSAGNQIAGPLSENVTVAGDSVLATYPTANLPLGTDIAVAGNPIPPNPFTVAANIPFDVNLALGGVGPVKNDVVAGSEFFGGDFTQARIGNLSADTQ